MIDYLIRAENRQAWKAFGQEQGWLVVDPELGLQPAPGVLVDELGPVMITPPVFAPGREEILEPAVMDDWHHVNLRLTEEPDEDVPAAMARHFKSGRAVVAPRNVGAIEGGEPGSLVQVLYPEDIATPRRIWADGMAHGPLPDPPATRKKGKKK